MDGGRGPVLNCYCLDTGPPASRVRPPPPSPPPPPPPLALQVFPVVSRLCAPIEGTDAGRLADCLGLDGARYRQAAAAAGAGEAREDALLAAAASLDDDDRWGWGGVG